MALPLQLIGEIYVLVRDFAAVVLSYDAAERLFDRLALSVQMARNAIE